jgi:hypothetical protein
LTLSFTFVKINMTDFLSKKFNYLQPYAAVYNTPQNSDQRIS